MNPSEAESAPTTAETPAFARGGARRRVLVAGVGPLPPEAPEKLFAPGLRVWGAAEALARAGHDVRLATVEFSGEPLRRLRVREARAANPASPATLGPAREVPLSEGGLGEALAREAEDQGAEAVFGSTDLVARALTALDPRTPVWMDYFGDPMAERQMLAALHGSDGGLADQWSTLAPALRRADRLSGCSRYQVGALLGEAAALGRLNRHTVAEPLVELLPPWIAPVAPCDDPGPFVRGVLAPPDAFLVVQTGGFNTWLDVDTLFAALSLAMDRVPKLRFVATGGAIPGHNEIGFARFEALARESPRRDRFHLLGWLPLGRVPRVIAECDVGLNVDRPGPEGWLGTRNRLMDWALAGLPVVSTLGTELAEELAERFGERGVYVAPQGDADALARALADAAEVAAGRRTNGGAGPRRRENESDRTSGSESAIAREADWPPAEWLRRERSPERCLAPLLRWVESPRLAPDRAAWLAGEAPPALWLAGDAAGAAAALEEERARRARAESRLARLEGSRLVRLAMRLRRKNG